MSRLTSKTVLAATVAGLAVAGGGAAIAASQTDSQGSSFLDSVAKHLGISSEELEDATKAAAVDQVDQALADGKITQEQADALKQRIESGEAPFFLGPGMFGFRHSFGGQGDNGGRFGDPGHHFSSATSSALPPSTSSSPRTSSTGSSAPASPSRTSPRRKASRWTA